MDSLPSKMLACQVVKFHEPYVVHDVPVPKSLGPHDILLKTAVASLCHTDSMVQEGRMIGTKLPITASHEGTGKVVGLGSQVDDFKIGDRVLAGLPKNRCGTCEDCTSPDPQYCSNRDGSIGIQVDGAFAEYVVVDARNAAHLPDSLDFISAAPLACAGITVWRGVKQAAADKGQWLGIVGSGGGLGHLGIGFAKAQGIKIIGVDARDEGIALSKESGADIVLDARHGNEKVVEEVLKATDGKGVSASINLSEANSAAALACAITRKHGRMIQIAQPPEVVIPFRELVFRDIKVSGSLTGSPVEVQEMLEFAAKYGISVKTNVYHGLKEIPRMVSDSHGGKMKGKSVVVVDAAA